MNIFEVNTKLEAKGEIYFFLCMKKKEDSDGFFKEGEPSHPEIMYQNRNIIFGYN